MVWYNISLINGEYRIYKNIEIGKGMANKKIFVGSEKECLEYCEKNNIKLGKKNKKVIS